MLLTPKIIGPLYFFLMWGSAWAFGQAPVVTSNISPAAVTLGQTATYKVSIEGDDQPKRFNLPIVSDLELTYIGTSQSMHSSIINGRIKSVATRTYNFRTLANKTGTFIIPTYHLEIEGRRATVPAATLTVLPPDGKTNVTLEELAFLELEPYEGPIYVGQRARYKLNLFVLASITNVSFIDLTQKGDAFSQSEAPKAADTAGARRNNLNYQVYSFPVIVTPLKSGTHDIEYELPIEVTFPRQRSRSRSSSFDRFFNDDFFGFGNLRDRRQLRPSTERVALEITPLPEEGKPTGFSGAIGLFSIKQNLSSKEVNAGDPITLTVEISGEGNFDRIQPLDVAVGDDWKTYSPKSNFVAQDEQNYSGTKTFEYVLIPESTTITASPTVNFSFFNPEDSEYVELTPKAIALKVNPAPPTQTFVPLVANGSGRGEPGSASRPVRERSILPIKLLPGRWVPAILPAFRSVDFYYAQMLPFLLLTGVYLIRKRQLRLSEDVDYARRRRAGKAMRNWLNKATAAAAGEDASSFFAFAQRAIQESLGRHFQSEAETLTLVELQQFFSSVEAPPELVEEVQQFFQESDAIRFAGSKSKERTLRQWNKTLTQLVAALSDLK